MRVLPGTFGDVIQARVLYPELLENYFDSCTGVAYSKSSDDVIIIPECHRLLDAQAGDKFIALEDGEFARLKGLGYVMTREEIANNPRQAWIYAVNDCPELIEQYEDTLTASPYTTGNLIFLLRPKNEIKQDQLRALYVSNRGISYYASAGYNLNNLIAFLRVSSPDQFRTK